MIPIFPQTHLAQLVLEQKTIQLLYQPKLRDLLGFFMQQPATLSQASKALGLDLKRTYNHVQTLLKHQLLQIDHLEPRAGRDLRWYRASAKDYFVPFAVSGFVDYGELIESQSTALQKAVLYQFEAFFQKLDPERFGTRFFMDPDGKTHFALTYKDDWQANWILEQLLRPDEPALFYSLGQIELSQPQAKQLQLELAELWRRYYFMSVEKPTDHPRPFVLGLNLALNT